MKPRKVILTLEVLSNAPLGILRNTKNYNLELSEEYDVEVLQAQANVIEPQERYKIGGTDPD